MPRKYSGYHRLLKSASDEDRMRAERKRNGVSIHARKAIEAACVAWSYRHFGCNCFSSMRQQITASVKGASAK